MYTLNVGVALYMTEEIETILSVLSSIYGMFNLPLVITSGIDGPHRMGSLHEKFRAIDIRKKFPDPLDAETWMIHGNRIIDMAETVFRIKNFPIVIVNEQDHLHVEWQLQ